MIYEVRNIQNLIRWNEWYDSKLSLFFLVFYYMLFIYNKTQMSDLYLLLPLGIFFISLASFGFMFNNYCDKIKDKVSGKANAMNRLNEPLQIFALTIPIIISLVAFIPFYAYKFGIVFVCLSYLSSILYSANPFRFKEKGVFGLICVSLAQWVFPALVVFAIFEHFEMDTIFFTILFFFIGLRWILVHQLIDRDNDIKANISTFSVTQSPKKIYRIMQLLFVIEFITFTGLIWFMAYFISFKILPLIIAYLLFEFYLFPLWKKTGFRSMLVSYDYAPLSNFYFSWLPLWFSILLGYLNPWFFIITGIEILWKKNYLEFDMYLIKLRSHI